MISLLISFGVLILGWVFYGRLTERIFAPDDRPTPAILAVIGVIACPVTSGDTAFRGARLILAEWTGLDQKKIRNRLIITIPLLAAGAVLAQLDFDVLWRYFSWSNQTLAMVALWVATAYLVQRGGKKHASLITAIPAGFMSAVSMTYILMAQEGGRLPGRIAYPIGAALAAALVVLYVILTSRKHNRADLCETK